MPTYKLIKLSSPGFHLESEDIRHVYNVLDMYVCESCKWHDPNDEMSTWPENYDDLSFEDKVHELLWTSCGAEFILEVDGVGPKWELVGEVGNELENILLGTPNE